MSAASPPRHWAQVDEVTFIAGIRFLLWLFRTVGRLPFMVCLYPAVCFYYLTNPRARTASREYFARLRRKPVSARTVFRHFMSFADSILDSLLVWSHAPNAIHIERHNQHVLTDRLAEGRGGLIITAHVGNASLCRALSTARTDLKLNVFAHTKHAEAFNRLLEELNPESAVSLMQVTELSAETAIRISERVSQGEFVVIAGDRVPLSIDPRTVMADFLGEQAPFPVGPYVLASVLRCPAYLLFCMKQGEDYHVYYELFREEIHLPRRDREAVLTELAGAYAKRVAHYCRLEPLQWFNFYDFWAAPQSVVTDASR